MLIRIHGKEILLFNVRYGNATVTPNDPNPPINPDIPEEPETPETPDNPDTPTEPEEPDDPSAPMLAAPIISVYGNTLTITDISDGLAEAFHILVDGEVRAIVEGSVS